MTKRSTDRFLRKSQSSEIKVDAWVTYPESITTQECPSSNKIEFEERSKDLKAKKDELDEIIAETEKEEKELMKDSEVASANIEDRLLNAYKRIRSNSRNGLAVVAVERDACGGCYNKIPPQRQLDIRLNKKIIVCEHCGRVLVDGMLIPDSGLEDVKKS